MIYDTSQIFRRNGSLRIECCCDLAGSCHIRERLRARSNVTCTCCLYCTHMSWLYFPKGEEKVRNSKSFCNEDSGRRSVAVHGAETPPASAIVAVRGAETG